MLVMQYFKHPDIASHLYDRFLEAYGMLPWNDEVLIYFAKLLYERLFLGMKPNYNDLPSEYYGTRRGRLCDCKGALCHTKLSRRPPPLVYQTPCLINFWSKMYVTSQIG